MKMRTNTQGDLTRPLLKIFSLTYIIRIAWLIHFVKVFVHNYCIIVHQSGILCMISLF